MDIAQKLVEAYFDKKMRKFGKRLNKVAKKLGVSPTELVKFCEPLLKDAWNKHLSN